MFIERSETICINKYENWEAVLIIALYEILNICINFFLQFLITDQIKCFHKIMNYELFAWFIHNFNKFSCIKDVLSSKLFFFNTCNYKFYVLDKHNLRHLFTSISLSLNWILDKW